MMTYFDTFLEWCRKYSYEIENKNFDFAAWMYVFHPGALLKKSQELFDLNGKKGAVECRPATKDAELCTICNASACRHIRAKGLVSKDAELAAAKNALMHTLANGHASRCYGAQKNMQCSCHLEDVRAALIKLGVSL